MVLAPVLVGLALAAFAWPAARLAPREVPIGVVEQRLTGEGDAVEVHRFADQASARAAIAGSPGAGSVRVVDVVASAGAGLVAVGVAQGWLGVLGGDWPVNAGGLGLTVLAVGATIAGLAAVFGRAGVALWALLMVLVGNPLSGVSSAPSLVSL
jgi:hypothetical protein